MSNVRDEEFAKTIAELIELKRKYKELEEDFNVLKKKGELALFIRKLPSWEKAKLKKQYYDPKYEEQIKELVFNLHTKNQNISYRDRVINRAKEHIKICHEILDNNNIKYPEYLD